MSMHSDLPKNRLACISQIECAFAACEKPTLDKLAPDGGIDGPYVIKNWGHLTRETVLELPYFGNYHGEDLSYMSSSGIRYFLPSILILFLRHPENIENEGFACLVTRLEGVFGCRKKTPHYRQIRLVSAQREAIHEWCGQIMTILRKFKLGPWQAEQMARLKALRRAARTNATDHDYEDLAP